MTSSCWCSPVDEARAKKTFRSSRFPSFLKTINLIKWIEHLRKIHLTENNQPDQMRKFHLTENENVRKFHLTKNNQPDKMRKIPPHKKWKCEKISPDNKFHLTERHSRCRQRPALYRPRQAWEARIRPSSCSGGGRRDSRAIGRKPKSTSSYPWIGQEGKSTSSSLITNLLPMMYIKALK